MNVNKSAVTISALLVALLSLQSGAARCQAPIVRACGLSEVDGEAFLAAELTSPVGQALVSLRWFNNDGEQPFASIALLEGQPGQPPDLTQGALVHNEVFGLSSDWSTLAFDDPVSSTTGTIHVVFVLHDDGVYRDEGAFGGPGVGYVESGTGSPAYASIDGLDWLRIHPMYRLAIEPCFGMPKRAANLLGENPPFRSGARVDRTSESNGARAILALRASPNPFNPATEIRYTLERAASVRIAVYDSRGREVRELHVGQQESGTHSVVWRGEDEHGSAVASGIYFLRLDADSQTTTQSVALVR